MPINKLRTKWDYENKIRDGSRKMSLNVAYNQNYSSGIDTAAIKEITQQIFQRASAKSAETPNFDLTKFNRASLGTDLYSVDAATARQIAATNLGMGVNLNDNTLNSLKYLSSEASKSIFQNVDGKISLVSINTASAETKNTVGLPSFGRLTETADLDSDKKGSNPFYKGELLNNKDNNKDEKDEVLNIFA